MTAEKKALTTTPAKYQITNQFVSDRVQWRLSGTSPGFALEWIGFSYEFESEW